MQPPPPYFIFKDAAQLLEVAELVCDDQEARHISGLVDRGLPPVAGLRSLSLITGFSRRFLATMAIRQARYYREFKIPKGGKFRQISAPKVSLKIVQKWFGHHLSLAVQLPDHVHGFVPGRSCFTAAHSHIGATWAVSVDIKDFFGSVNAHDVNEALTRLGYRHEARKILVPLLTLNQSLPQGSPASPVLANLALVGVDESLAEMCRREGLRFTRYADDITISGVDRIPPDGLVDSVEEICRQHTYSLNPKKTSSILVPTKVRVLGLLVHGNELRLPKSLRNRVRSAQYRFELSRAYENELSVSARDLGLLSYAGALERFNLQQEG